MNVKVPTALTDWPAAVFHVTAKANKTNPKNSKQEQNNPSPEKACSMVSNYTNI